MKDERELWAQVFNVASKPFNLGPRREFPRDTTDGYSVKTYAQKNAQERLSIPTQSQDVLLDKLL